MYETFNQLDSASKINVDLGSVLRIVETGEYRYYYAHKDNTSTQKLLLQCTKEVLITIQGKVEKFRIVRQSTQERQNKKWRFKLISNHENFCCVAQKFSYGMSKLCPTRIFTEQSFCKLSLVKQKQATLQTSSVSLPSIIKVLQWS